MIKKKVSLSILITSLLFSCTFLGMEQEQHIQNLEQKLTRLERQSQQELSRQSIRYLEEILDEIAIYNTYKEETMLFSEFKNKINQIILEKEITRLGRTIQLYIQNNMLIKQNPDNIINHTITEIEKFRESSKNQMAFSRLMETLTWAKKIRILLEERDTTEGLIEFDITSGNKTFRNVVVRLKSINQFDKKYLAWVKKNIKNPEQAELTCPGMSLRSAKAFYKYFKENNLINIKDLNNYTDAQAFVMWLEKGEKTQITDLDKEALDIIIKKEIIKELNPSNTSVIDSVGVFYTPFLVDPDIYKKFEPEKNFLTHTFILGSLDQAYFPEIQQNRLIHRIFRHWICVFVIKFFNTFYWFIVDTSKKDVYNEPQIYLNKQTPEYTRIRYFIENILKSDRKIDYKNILINYHKIKDDLENKKVILQYQQLTPDQKTKIQNEINELRGRLDSIKEEIKRHGLE